MGLMSEKVVKKVSERLKKETIIHEAYFTALFYNNPSLYAFYPEDKINVKTFQNPAWGFFFGLGRSLHKKEIKIFDDISVVNHAKEIGILEKFENYGGYASVEEVMYEVQGKEDNIDAYYDEIKKYALLKNLVELFGEKVLTPNGKYNYKLMTKNQIHIFWNDQVNQLGMDGDNKYDEHDLLKGLKQDILRWSVNPAVGLPFYKSPQMTKITTGWDFGNLYLFGGFGGSGKTSMSFNKVIMSCIEKREKLLILANEQGIDEFKKMLIITAMGVGTKNSFNRQRINEGEFTDEEFDRMNKAVEWVEELCGEDDSIIKFVFMEDYIMEDVKKVIRHYANRGYKSVMIDTGKPSEGGSQMVRWERFTEDFKDLYKLCRPNGGGLNLRMWVNVQLGDASLRSRYLDEHAFGDSKKIKNEASVVFMIRAVWVDEFKDGTNELQVYKWEHDPENPFANENGMIKKEFTLEQGKVFYLLFTPKNRRGRDIKTGLDILVLQPNFNNNTWREVGWTQVANDRNY
jgi:replicative DNA helicase